MNARTVLFSWLWPLAGALAGCGAASPSAPVAPCACGDARGESRGACTDEPSRDAPGLVVRRGEHETGWLPGEVIVDLGPREEEELVVHVRSWLSGGPERPLIEHQRGILFVKSEDDEGADPPYPSSSARMSMRVCGLPASWLREQLRATFAMVAGPDFDGVTCHENACFISGMEYVSDRAVVFRRVSLGDAPAWAIESTYEIAEAALGEAHVLANRRYVAAELARHAEGTCPGEPPGFR